MLELKAHAEKQDRDKKRNEAKKKAQEDQASKKAALIEA
jgi:hypothetical protein